LTNFSLANCPAHGNCTPLVNGCISDALLNAAMQNIKQALLQNIAVMFNDISNTQKI